MSEIKQAMPLLARHEGVWDGWYRVFDGEGNKMDEHRSRLICRFPLEGPHPYHQTNLYTWADGLTGWAAEVDLDPFRRTVMLYWERQGEPDLYLYEMIHLSDCGRFRSRTWQWLRNGRIHLRTLIDEEKVSDDWRGF